MFLDYEKQASQNMRRLARIAGTAVKLMIRSIAKIIGVPVLTTALILLIAIVVILSIWGALPYEAQAAPEKPDYEHTAENSFPGIKSEDSAELEHKLTWGILAAVDYLGGAALGESKPKNTAKKTAKLIGPRFEYKDSTITTKRKVTKTVTQPDGTSKKVTTTETKTKDVKLLIRADTYRGVYIYTYRWVTVKEDGAEVTKEVQDSVTYAPDWSRLQDALKERIGEDVEPTIEEAIGCYNLGLGFDSGQENLAWLGDEEDAWATGAAGGWDSDPSLPLPTGEFVWPVEGKVTSPFGKRIHPVYGENRPHNGIDIAVSLGTPVKAAADGMVRFADWQGGFGKLVVIDHGGGVLSFYGHLMDFEIKVGDEVQKSDVIAYSGSTGVSTGPHLHFEIRIDGTPVDPVEVITKRKELNFDSLLSLFQEAEAATGVDAKLLEAIAWVESRFDANCVSGAGAQGIMQIMPGTAKDLGITDPYDARQSILGGARYFKQLKEKFGSTELALAAYNAGPSNVEQHKGMPPFPETQAYVKKVMRYWQQAK